MTEPTRPLWMIRNDMTRLRQEAKAAKPGCMFSPAFKRSRSFRPEGAGQRQPRERDNGFCQYIRRQPCEARHKGGCAGPIQHAHVSYQAHGIPNSFGRGSKNHDRHGNPLCAEHHRIQGEVMGEKPFWAWLGKDAYETAAGHYAAYLAGADGPTRKALRQAASDETSQVGTPEGVKQNTAQGGVIAP